MTSCLSKKSDLLKDFDLPKELKTCKLIGIGEVVHGSGGLHQLTTDLIDKMIQVFDVRTILFEAPYGAVAKINDFIVRGEEVPPGLLNDLYFVWRSEENLRFFRKLSNINKT